jgi:hypothetical protein
MTSPDPTRRTRNIIGIVAIVLLILFFLLEFVGLFDFYVWLALVIVTFVVANLALRQVKKRQM